MNIIYEVYNVKTGKHYQYCETERSAKIVTTRQNKEAEYIRTQGIYNDIGTFAYRTVEV